LLQLSVNNNYFNILPGVWLLKWIVSFIRDVPYDAEITFHGEKGVRRQESGVRSQNPAGKNEPPRHEDTKKNK
jgi:hypothetical protein